MTRKQKNEPPSDRASKGPGGPQPSTPLDLTRKHLRIGWWTLAIFLTLGLSLEVLHALKLSWYLHAANDTRRLLLTLGHAHGALLGLVNIAFALTLPHLRSPTTTLHRPSAALLAATILLPSGFLLGGLIIHGGDPNGAIFLVPIGALLLLYTVITTARHVTTTP